MVILCSLHKFWWRILWPPYFSFQKFMTQSIFGTPIPKKLMILSPFRFGVFWFNNFTRVVVTTSEDYHPDQIPQFLSSEIRCIWHQHQNWGGGKRKYMGKKDKTVHEACKIYHFYTEIIKFFYHIWNYLRGY